jgi:hypothetical protein
MPGNFLIVLPDIGIIANTATAHANLESIKNEFGLNFNTLLIRNGASEELILKLNGRSVAHIAGSGGLFNMDWQDNIIFDDMQITNNDTITSTSANEIRISIGRTGQ